MAGHPMALGPSAGSWTQTGSGTLERGCPSMSFAMSLSRLVAPLDPRRHATEIAQLRACRSVQDLERLSQSGWLTPGSKDPRLKLVRHGSGTYLVVQYDEGWSTRLSMELFAR